jgi:hypothetical protein
MPHKNAADSRRNDSINALAELSALNGARRNLLAEFLRNARIAKHVSALKVTV